MDFLRFARKRSGFLSAFFRTIVWCRVA